MSFFGSLFTTEIDCDFDKHTYDAVRKTYRCEVLRNPRMNTPETAMITKVNGQHDKNRNNTLVTAFRAGGSKMEIFPKRMHVFFNNLKAIVIKDSKISEIFQTDLMPYDKLVYLKIDDSFVKILEQGLFDYNTNLQFLGINSKYIIHIDPNVFDKLDLLRYIKFSDVPCILKNVENSKSKVKVIKQEIKDNCIDSEFTVQKSKFEVLKFEVGKNISAFETDYLFNEYEKDIQ